MSLQIRWLISDFDATPQRLSSDFDAIPQRLNKFAEKPVVVLHHYRKLAFGWRSTLSAAIKPFFFLRGL
jgi:hypothetical protein